MEKEGKSIERLNDEGWITYIAFPVQVAGHLTISTKCYRVKQSACKIKFRMLGN